jgi:transcription-repair coupling factor (superfamily II helicase)
MKKSKNEKARLEYQGELEELDSGRELLSVDKYISYIYPQKQCLLDYFGEDVLTVVLDYNGVMERMHSYDFQENESFRTLLEEGIVDPNYSLHYNNENLLKSYITERRTVIVNSFAASLGGMELGEMYAIPSKTIAGLADNFSVFYEELDNYRRIGYKIRICCDSEQGAKNFLNTLIDKGYPVSLQETDSEIRLLAAPNLTGFELETAKFVLLSVCRGGYGIRNKKKIASPQKKSLQKNTERILSYTDLQKGDFVVHSTHGIGIYLGIESLNIGGCRKDFVKIQYAGTDLLYLPCNQLDTLSKYVGASEGAGVKLSKMGSGEWSKTTKKVKTAAKAIAKELIQLYASRLRKKGFAFAKDDAMDREFADTFEYTETSGQLDAIADIRRDMESDHPMDRLLCGDVGYGKTEVALRAAFKAVQSGKQVAILVPTTILALQHYQTIVSRMRGFPVNTDMISRFRSAKQQEVTLRRLERGEVDIIVGTHRLLSKDIQFHDLGLIIVDEEQRFGVAQKEKLKSITQNVDVLMLSATPIPRTMNMALSGIRDMSILEEAPGDRIPVQSYVTEYNDGIILEAIRRELHRGGQVFYLCNRIPHIPDIVGKLSQAIPEARIGVGHGQMDKEDLSDVWHSMIIGETDILVCTTIIETGVDVPNANTLIVENADQMGLSQLHQIRGRVGRSSRRAYAYFTYPEGKVLTEVAEKRLEAIRDFTEFGAGFRIAMRDLEIRGAGDILGAEQHGHMASVGYDLYIKILNEAILEEKGEVVPKHTECTVDFNIDAYIPELYIENSNQRMEAYKKISLIRNAEDLYDISDELIDRYGEMPRAVYNLLHIALLRSLGAESNLTKIQYKESSVLFYPENFLIKPWTALAAQNNGKLLISLGNVPYVTAKITKSMSVFDFSEKLLVEYQKINSQEINS